jgi:hypothetical protein
MILGDSIFTQYDDRQRRGQHDVSKVCCLRPTIRLLVLAGHYPLAFLLGH